MNLIKIIGSFVLFELVSAIPLYILQVFNGNLFSYYSLGTLFIIIQLTYVFLENKHYKLNIFNLKGRNYRKTITLGIILILINQLVFTFLESKNIISAPPSITNLYEHHEMFIIIYVLLLGPILEETFFRGIFYKILLPNNTIMSYKPWIIIFINAILFSYLHSPSGLTSVYYFIGSIVLSVSYLKSKDLKVPILLHSFNNLLSIVISALIIS